MPERLVFAPPGSSAHCRPPPASRYVLLRGTLVARNNFRRRPESSAHDRPRLVLPESSVMSVSPPYRRPPAALWVAAQEKLQRSRFASLLVDVAGRCTKAREVRRAGGAVLRLAHPMSVSYRRPSVERTGPWVAGSADGREQKGVGELGHLEGLRADVVARLVVAVRSDVLEFARAAGLRVLQLQGVSRTKWAGRCGSSCQDPAGNGLAVGRCSLLPDGGR